MKDWLKQNLIYILAIALLLFIINQLPPFINSIKGILSTNISSEQLFESDDLTDNPQMKCSECPPTSTDLFCKYCRNWDLSD